MLWLFLFIGVLAVVVASCFTWYKYSSPYSAKDCPNCLGVKTYRRTSSQTLAAIGTGGPKGQRQQIIETYACSNCGHAVTRNRLAATQQNETPGHS